VHFTVSDYVLDIVHNSIQAKAEAIALTVESVGTAARESRMTVEVRDDGPGMSAEQVARALDPFYTDGTKHRNRRVGLGLPFLAQAMEAVDGEMSVDSTPGLGTTVRFSFEQGHVDAPPAGDLAECFAACLAFDGDYELEIERRCAGERYRIERGELREALGGFDDVGARSLLLQYIQSAETETCGGMEWLR
jgi:hypothetical protein